MGRSTTRTSDIDRLRDIVDVADTAAVASPVEAMYAVLDRLQVLVGSDWASFHDLDSARRTFQHGQVSEDGLHEAFGPVEGEDPDDDPFWWHYHSSPCSLPDRVGAPLVVSVREVLSERQWAGHPMQLDSRDVIADELVASIPYRDGRTLRLILARTSGAPFGDRERFLLRLLQPQLRPLLVQTIQAVDPVPHLTPRQQQILTLVRLGMTNQQVARQLGISPGTVRKHLEHSYGVLQVQSRTAAVGAAFTEA